MPFDGEAVLTGRWDDGEVGPCVTRDGACEVVRDGIDRRVAAVTIEVTDVAATAHGDLAAWDGAASERR